MAYIQGFKPFLHEFPVCSSAPRVCGIATNDRGSLEQCHAVFEKLAEMGRVLPGLFSPQDYQCNRQVYGRQKSPFVCLQRTGSWLPVVLWNMIDPAGGYCVSNHLLDEAEALNRDGLRPMSAAVASQGF